MAATLFPSPIFGSSFFRLVRGKAAFLLGLAIAVVAPIYAADTQADVLAADIIRLKRELADKEKAFGALVNAKLTEKSPIQESTASSLFNRGSLKKIAAPTSSLDRQSAIRAAYGSNVFVKGSVIKSVAATGSMEPVISEHSYVLLEPAPFEDLRVGDIVTYLHPAVNEPVTHRLIAKRGDGFIAKGDHNSDVDNVYVTKANYQMRVYGIIYSSQSTSG